VAILRTLHIYGAIFLLGGVSAHVLLRPMAGRAEAAARQALYAFAWRVQVVLVYTGSAFVLITGLTLWVGRFKFFTGWLLLGFLLFSCRHGSRRSISRTKPSPPAGGDGRERQPPNR